MKKIFKGAKLNNVIGHDFIEVKKYDENGLPYWTEEIIDTNTGKHYLDFFVAKKCNEDSCIYESLIELDDRYISEEAELAILNKEFAKKEQLCNILFNRLLMFYIPTMRVKIYDTKIEENLILFLKYKLRFTYRRSQEWIDENEMFIKIAVCDFYKKVLMA